MKAYKLFTPEEAKEMASALKDWSPGKANQEKVGKHNDEAVSEEIAKRIEAKVLQGPIPTLHFVEQLSPIKFNRYRDGGEYAAHSDSCQMHGVRSDLACTLFLSDDYEGGELCVDQHEVKLPPGHCVVYECWRPHWVKPVTKGERIAAIFWLQSYIRNEDQRDLLGMLRSVIAETKNEQHFAILGAVHERLVKTWWS